MIIPVHWIKKTSKTKNQYLFFLKNIELFTQGCFVASLLEIGLVVMEKIILKIVNISSLCRCYLPLENKLKSSLPQEVLC